MYNRIAAYPYHRYRKITREFRALWKNYLYQFQENAEMYLSKIGEDMKKACIEIETVILKETKINQEAELILDFAEKNNIDLIVMSTHGRSGPARWAFGSVADRVVRHAKCPVLTIIPADCRIDRNL